MVTKYPVYVSSDEPEKFGPTWGFSTLGNVVESSNPGETLYSNTTTTPAISYKLLPSYTPIYPKAQRWMIRVGRLAAAIYDTNHIDLSSILGFTLPNYNGFQVKVAVELRRSIVIGVGGSARLVFIYYNGSSWVKTSLAYQQSIDLLNNIINPTLTLSRAMDSNGIWRLKLEFTCDAPGSISISGYVPILPTILNPLTVEPIHSCFGIGYSYGDYFYAVASGFTAQSNIFRNENLGNFIGTYYYKYLNDKVLVRDIPEPRVIR